MYGFNLYLENHFMKYIEKMAETRSQYSATLYSTVYNLMKKEKLQLRFHVWPDAGLKSGTIIPYFGSGKWGSVNGGLRYSQNDIKLVVWIRPGYEIEKLLIEPIMMNIYKNLLGAVLHEGIFLYNKRTNGALINLKEVENWYNNYFAMSVDAITGRKTVAKYIGAYMGKSYSTDIFKEIEIPIMNGLTPAPKEKGTHGFKVDLMKGEKLLKKFFTAQLKKVIREYLPNDMDVDTHTRDALEVYIDQFGEFATFMFENREQNFKPSEFANIPSIIPAIHSPNIFREGDWSVNVVYNSPIGFKEFANPTLFDEVYEYTTGGKDIYDKEFSFFFKKNYVYSELYMPSAIYGKYVYYNVCQAKDFAPAVINLIDCGTKGLESLL